MPSPDPWRALDAQPNVAALIAGLEARGGTPTQIRLRRRFLRFVPVRPSDRVLEVGCGSGVVLLDPKSEEPLARIPVKEDDKADVLNKALDEAAKLFKK